MTLEETDVYKQALAELDKAVDEVMQGVTPETSDADKELFAQLNKRAEELKVMDRNKLTIRVALLELAAMALAAE